MSLVHSQSFNFQSYLGMFIKETDGTDVAYGIFFFPKWIEQVQEAGLVTVESVGQVPDLDLVATLSYIEFEARLLKKILQRCVPKHDFWVAITMEHVYILALICAYICLNMCIYLPLNYLVTTYLKWQIQIILKWTHLLINIYDLARSISFVDYNIVYLGNNT